MVADYLSSICRIIIAEYNSITRSLSDDEKVQFANRMVELDLLFRLGSPFRHLARYGFNGADLVVDELSVSIQLKYWRLQGRTKTRASLWDKHFTKDLVWLLQELEGGKKGSRALVVAWSRYVPWKSLLALGSRGGRNVPVAAGRLDLLPFLDCNCTTGRSVIDDIFTNYDGPRRGQREMIWEGHTGMVDWQLFGGDKDFLNIAMYS